MPKGGPDGGDGGHGGSVVLLADPSRRDLGALSRAPHYRAGRGRHGQGANRHGARGDDEVILVPPGTQATALDGSRIDLTEPGQRAVIARGGRGGHGNRRFANSTRQTPRFAERGTAGEEGWVELRLKLHADAGLIGMPNAGKSSLLARLTRAAPKVADYPFTTVEPVLGTIEDDDRQAVLADIPGLIEGAAGGAGLGHEFLAHVERCRMLIHLVELAPLEGDPVDQLRGGARGARLLRRRARRAARAGRALEAGPAVAGGGGGGGGRVGGAPHGSGPRRARGVVGDRRGPRRAPPRGPRRAARAAPAARPEPAGEPEFEVDFRMYRPEGEGGYRVEREDDGAFRVRGRGVEMLFERHDLANEEALAYLEQRLNEIGVVAALRSAGFEPGDEVRIGGHEFELHPG